jgi:hypothetical protein
MYRIISKKAGGNIAKSFLPKISAILAHSAIFGLFVLRAYIAGFFSPKNFGDIGLPQCFYEIFVKILNDLFRNFYLLASFISALFGRLEIFSY